MLESLLIGLITSGVYYAAQRHRDWLDEKHDLAVRTREEIQSSLETGLKTVFPNIAKNLGQLGLDDEQARKLKELLSAGDPELEMMLREKIAGELYNLSARIGWGGDAYLDMFSVDEIGKVLQEIYHRKMVPGLKEETITFAAPRLIVLLLQEPIFYPDYS